MPVKLVEIRVIAVLWILRVHRIGLAAFKRAQGTFVKFGRVGKSLNVVRQFLQNQVQGLPATAQGRADRSRDAKIRPGGKHLADGSGLLSPPLGERSIDLTAEHTRLAVDDVQPGFTVSDQNEIGHGGNGCSRILDRREDPLEQNAAAGEVYTA